MIGKSRVWTLFVLMCAFAGGCASKATDEEINQMCNNLVKVKGEISSDTVEQRVAKGNEEITRKEKRLKEWREKDLGRLDDELFAKSAATTDEAEKAKITEEIEKKKDAIADKYDARLAGIPAEKKAILGDAQARAAADKKAWDKAVQECVEAAKKESVSQKVAQCRMKTKTPEAYWNNCW